ncbi:MAG: hypothetical protein HZB85_08645 [Deltaproteobacteria bacterium]|nr:hypothetical protein [Deltaproteobacteria bacterium]
MLETIRVLEEIQRLDLEIAATEEEEKRYLLDIEIADARAAALAGTRDKASAEMGDINTRIRDIDEEIRKCGERVQKDEKRLGEIKNDRELKALNKEMTTANKAVKQHEEEKERVVARLAEKKTAHDAAVAALGDATGLSERLSGEMASKKPAWEEIRQKDAALKETEKSRISPQIFKKYESIRSKRGGIGLAKVVNETCHGCFIHIPPQVYIMLKRGVSELMTCPHCHRILYTEADPAPGTNSQPGA